MPKLRLNSQTAIKAKRKIYNRKNTHTYLRYNIIGQLLETRIVSLDFVRLELNLVDPLLFDGFIINVLK